MGVYAEYLDRNLDFQALTAERKNQLKRIYNLRAGRDLIVYAADLNDRHVRISMDNSDLLPFHDQLSNLSGTSLDIILETPGGSAEIAEQMVREIRERYDDVAIIVPGTAKSAGTIMAMSADDILMGSTSALGPIDAQMSWQGKVFSADALLKGFDKIKDEVDKNKKLNLAHIPILQQISPGELQSAQNALDFAKKLVKDWLACYKFKNWVTHSSDGSEVKACDRDKRASEIAGQLCDHGRWLTHGRSIMMSDLRGMKLKIKNYNDRVDLADAINRYYTLLQMTFSTTSIYKVIETTTSQIYRYSTPPGQPSGIRPENLGSVMFDGTCGKCGNRFKVQANFEKGVALQPGSLPFPADNKVKCPKCGAESDLTGMRRQIEMEAKKKIIIES